MSNPQATRQRHALNRIAALVIETFSIVTRVTDRRVLLRKEPVGNELHLFYCDKFELADEEAVQASGYTSIEAEDAMRAHNHCVFVCKVFAGILAWFIEELDLPITVEEVNLKHVEERQPVVCIDIIRDITRRIAAIHTMFKITSSDAYPEPDGLVEEEGLYLDPSAPQYQRAAGVYAVESYPGQPSSTTLLGGAYIMHLRALHADSGFRNFRLEAIIRAVNNEMYKKVNDLGGPKILADRDAARWGVFEKEILASIKARLQSLVTMIDNPSIPDGVDRVTHHQLIARDCFGPGHEAIVGSLERVSGGVQVTRWQNI